MNTPNTTADAKQNIWNIKNVDGWYQKKLYCKVMAPNILELIQSSQCNSVTPRRSKYQSALLILKSFNYTEGRTEFTNTFS